VVVTPRALKADAEEDLADRLGGGHRVAIRAVEAGRRVLPGGALGRDDLPGELIERQVARDRVAQPALEDPYALVAHRLFFVAEQVGPLERPEIGKLRKADQTIDQPFAPGGIGRAEEAARLIERGKTADGVEAGTPQERGVIHRLRGIDPKCLEL